jgi:hypothetical protein
MVNNHQIAFIHFKEAQTLVLLKHLRIQSSKNNKKGLSAISIVEMDSKKVFKINFLQKKKKWGQTKNTRSCWL